jgi:hypothetical protein
VDLYISESISIGAFEGFSHSESSIEELNSIVVSGIVGTIMNEDYCTSSRLGIFDFHHEVSRECVELLLLHANQPHTPFHSFIWVSLVSTESILGDSEH